MSSKIFSPREFYKLKHPELFSDSKNIESVEINDNVLAYSLDMITSNNNEMNFQNLCEDLIKREICPNIIPQTGPTGGGDGKVDTENYPISESLLFFGQPKEASSERWGFAISAKKNWKSKAADDFQKIIDTNRGYSKIYYLSNQPISDKKKKNLEDDFAKSNPNIRFIILDKNWIMEKVKKQTNISLLNKHLGFSIKNDKQTGARDYDRIKKIAELNEKYNKTTKDIEKYDIAQEIISHSRGLEVPKEEIIGLISTLHDLVIVQNNIQYKIDAIYFSAWTVYWWYEDYILFYKYFCEMEKLIEEIRLESPHIILDYYESLNNLWLNLHAIYYSQLIEINYNAHTLVIVKEYEKIRDDETKTNLWKCLKPIYYKMQLLTGMVNTKDDSFSNIEEKFNQFAQAIIDAKESPDFNATSMIEVFLLNNSGFTKFSRYDEFFDKILDIKAERKGQLIKASAVLDRCPMLFKSNENYKVIKYLGKVFRDLHKEESRFEYISSVTFLGIAFRRIGLLFASRQYFFESLSEGLKYFSLNKEFHHSTKHVVKHLKDIELLMGKVIYAIQLNNLDLSMGTYYTDDEHSPFELYLAGLILKTEITDIKKLTKFPEYLYNNELLITEVVLKRMLGYYDEEFKKDNQIKLDEFIQEIINAPFYDQIKAKAFYGYENKIVLSSKIIGCNLVFDVENKEMLIEYATNIIASIESFLSTETLRNGIALRSNFKVKVVQNDSLKFTHNFNDLEQLLTLGFPKTDNIFLFEFQQELQKNCFEITILISTMITRNVDMSKFKKINDEEGVLERSIFPFSIMHNIMNAFGKEYFIYPDCSGFTEYPLNDKTYFSIPLTEKVKTGDKKTILGDMKFEFNYDPNKEKPVYSHNTIDVDEFIDIDLWDKAKWKGAIYLHSQNPNILPAIFLYFENIDYGNKIFDNWIKKYSKIDGNNDFKIEIIKGIDKHNPAFYRLAIGSNIKNKVVTESQLFSYSARIHTMQPNSLENLNNFEKNLFTKVYLAPFDYEKNMQMGEYEFYQEVEKVISTKSILIDKKSINIRWIKDIDEIDMLVSTCIFASDDPGLPKEHLISKYIEEKKSRNSF